MTTPALFTIGYEGATQDSVIAALRDAGVTHLLDIRAVPQSRKPGFSKTLLSSTLAASGIRYTHLRALGTPKPGRDAVRAGHVAIMHRIFRAHLQTPEAQFELLQAGVAARAEPCCLLCFERDHANCHRAIVAELLGGDVRHLAAA